jgi:predicted RND superfamily exporter protein/CRP-like cAMP-binding protein
VRRIFGTDETLLIALRSPDVFTHAELSRVARLTERLEREEGVHHVLSLTNAVDVRGVDDDLEIARFVDAVPSDPTALRELRERVLANPIYAGSLVSRDARTTALVVFFADMSHREYLASGLDERIVRLARAEAGDAELYVTGGPHIRAETARVMLSEAVRIPLLMLAALGAVLAFAYRSLRGVLLPLGTIVVAVLWSLALAVALDYELNAVTALVPPLLTTLGLSYAVHVVTEADQEARSLGLGGPRPVALALERVALPVGLTGATTAIGFGSLLLSPLAAVRDFGALSVIGVACTIAASLSFTPAALALLPGPRGGAVPTRDAFARFVERVARFTLARRQLIFAAAALIFVASLVGMRSIRIGSEQVAKFSRETPVRADFEAVNQQLGGANLLFVVLETDVPQGFMDPVNLEAIRSLQAWLEAQPEIGVTTSLADYVALINRGFHGNDPAALSIPGKKSTVSQLLLFGASDELDAFVDGRYQTASVRVRARVVDSNDVAALTQRIEGRLEQLPGQLRAKVTGTSVVLNRALDEIIRGQALSVGAALLLIYGVLALMFVSFRIGLVALIPNVLPVAVYFGALGWSGVRLNPGTSLVAPMVLGIAVDDTIHYFARFIRDAKQLGDEKRATASALKAVGRPVTYTSLALCVGFLMLNASELRTQGELGNLAAFALAFAWTTDFFLTPALCARLRIATLWDVLRVDLGHEPERSLSLLRGLRASQARIVAALARVVELRAGERLFHAGEPGGAAYVVIDGRLRTAIASTDGELEIATHARGATLGEAGLFEGRRTAQVDALTDSRLLRLSSQAVEDLGRRYPRIATVLLRNLNETLAAHASRVTHRHVQRSGELSDPEPLARGGRALDDAFFRRGAEAVRARLRAGDEAAADPDDHRIDPSLVDELTQLGVGAETLIALTLIPLVEVAWADGRLEESERRAVLAGAEACGIDPDSPSAALLRAWLDQPPEAELLALWRRLIRTICASLSYEARARLEAAIVGRARDVAESAGGVLGFGSVSDDEERVLATLGAAFHRGADDREEV